MARSRYGDPPWDRSTLPAGPRTHWGFTMRSLAIALVAGQLVGLLGWVDPLFVPLILLGPTVTGAAVAWQRGPVWFAPVLWASAGMNMLWTDWLVNREDVVFHLGVAVLTAVLATAAWFVVHVADAHGLRGEPPMPTAAS